MNKLIIIDGHAILHRAYHALPPLTTSRGELVNAVFGFTSMLLRVVSDLKPTHLIVTFDRPTPTFRNKLYKDYQIQRPKVDQELIGQIDTVHKVVEEMGIPYFEMDGYEADDIIGTIATKVGTYKSKKQNARLPPACRQGRARQAKLDQDIETIIVSGDRDMLQLVNPYTKVYMPVKGLSQSKLYGEHEVEEKFGVKPQQIIDYKALVGDPSDNYPGVPGVGPKTASSLIVQFATLEQLYKHLDQVKNEGLRKKLKENIKSAEMAKKLATIVTDTPIDLDLDKCKLPDFDKENVHLLFDRLEFRSLIPRLNRNARIVSPKKLLKEKKKEEQLTII